MKCSATPAPVMNHLWPWITQRSPFFSARVRIMPGSEPPPGAGSVIAKAERTLPSTIGRSHLSFCAGVPTSASRFMLPSSGAAQLNATGPKIERFASSYIAAQPTIGSPMPPNSFGACGAHRPCGLRLVAHAREQIEADVLVVVVVRPIGLERQHMLFHEGARAHADILDLGGQREIHGAAPRHCDIRRTRA